MPATPPGSLTLAEILSQPKCWAQSFQEVERSDALARARKGFSSSEEWLFIGCGSSYHVALAAAASWPSLTGCRARAVPASELLLFPHLVLSGSPRPKPVLISRSGRTSEVLQAGEYLEKKQKLPTLAISCAKDQALEQIASTTLHVPAADETSTVMTRSFTSMLLALQYVAATLAGRADFLASLRKLAASAQKVLDGLDARIRQFVTSNQFADYVFLGHGPFYGVACESMLKVQEMSCSYAQSFHTLEFRHGPKAIVGPETLVTFLLSETGAAAERDVLEEVKGLGGTTFVVTEAADEAVRRASDFLVELHLDVLENARLAPSIFAGQFLGFFTGLKKGLDPDRPRHLSRAVVLDKKA